jgi:histidine triad (HIT) family protein
MGSECIFCRIVAGEIPAEVVRDTERVLAFRDLNPQAPTHVLVIPRTHYATVAELAEHDPATLAEVVSTAGRIAVDEADGSYRLVVNTGPAAGQTVDHVHAHVLGGRSLTWPPG